MASDDGAGLSTQKKVVAGAALGVAIPAAIGVARKLAGGGGGEAHDASGEQAREQRPAGRQEPSRARQQARPAKSAKRASRAAAKTKEQLYREAKRLEVEGRSRMTKAQLERAVSKARG